MTQTDKQETRPWAYSVNDVGIMLGISRSMVYKLFRQGELKKFNIGTKSLVLVKDLIDFIEDRTE
jgi:predicted DNA-binding transcriptional regulator AlpA